MIYLRNLLSGCASHGKRVTRTCERRFLLATQRRARAIRTRHRDSNDLRHPDRGPERGNRNEYKRDQSARGATAYKKYIYLFTFHRLHNTCNWCIYNALYIIVRSPMQKIFETNTTLFFSFFANFYAFCTQLVHETRRKRAVFIIQIYRVTIFSYFNVVSKIRIEDVSSDVKRCLPFFFFFLFSLKVTNKRMMEGWRKVGIVGL